ncbi:serine hydrolase domain-containing protein [Actinacidiphila alni]|uniref:serine hydrolase domain-containing protein n=1 Tax=Actinacidiphila alni TaxID=380248 RepID=UPI003455E754
MTVRPLPARSLPVSTPAAQGVDARGVHAFLDALEDAAGIEPHSLMILRHGGIVAAGWWAPYTAERPHLLYSLSKSFTGSAAAFAVAEGLLDLDATVVSYFPEFDADVTDPGSRAMLVRHIASMASGHDAETWSRAVEADPREPVRGFLLLPPDRAPGTVFAYNQPTTYTLAAIIQRATGQTLTEYLRPRLLEPLGIGETAWHQYPAGRDLGYSGLHAATDAVARLGQLYLDGGRWEGRQLLPAGWAEEATRPHVANGDGSAEAARSDWAQGYGFQFWTSRHGYRGDGAYGQFCVVLPEQDAVIAMTAETNRMQAVLDFAWEHLLPAFGPTPRADEGAGGQESEADAALRERLAALAVPETDARPAPPDGPDAWSGARFTPRGGVCEDQTTLTAVELSAGDGGWALTLVEGAAEDAPRLTVRFTGTAWAVTDRPDAAVPVAVSAGWTDADTFVADLGFLETPHHLILTCTLADREVTARWRTHRVPSDPLAAYGARTRVLTP